MSKSKFPAPDVHLILATRKAFLPATRYALFGYFIWLGALKVFGLSTPTSLISQLRPQLTPFMSLDEFYMAIGITEVVLGLTMLIKGFERAAFILLLFHLIFTSLPLFILTQLTWQNWFVPTPVGEQAVIGSILALVAIGIVSQIAPVRRSKPKKIEEDKKTK